MTTTPVSAAGPGLPEPYSLLNLGDYIDQTRRFSEGVYLAGLGLSDKDERDAIAMLVEELNSRIDFISSKVEEMRTGGRS